MVMNSPRKRQLEETIVSKVIRTLKVGRAKKAEQPLPEPEPLSSATPTVEDLFRVSIRRGLHSKGIRSSEDARSLPPSKTDTELKTIENEPQCTSATVLGVIVFLVLFTYLLSLGCSGGIQSY